MDKFQTALLAAINEQTKLLTQIADSLERPVATIKVDDRVLADMRRRAARRS